MAVEHRAATSFRSNDPGAQGDHGTDMPGSPAVGGGRNLSAGSPVRDRRRELQDCVARLLDAAPNQRAPIEKRTHRRHAFRRPLTVTPVNNHSGRPDTLRSFPAFGIDLSSSGICFLARYLLPVRKAILTAEASGDQRVHLLFEPRWVRFTRGGWYQTGGRLLELLPEEHEPIPTIRLLETPPDIDELCESTRRR